VQCLSVLQCLIPIDLLRGIWVNTVFKVDVYVMGSSAVSAVSVCHVRVLLLVPGWYE
jgi:hypothetical protein